MHAEMYPLSESLSSGGGGGFLAQLRPKANTLRINHLAHTVPAVTVTDRVRERLRDEMQRQHLSQQQLVDRVNRRLPSHEQWSKSRLQKIVQGRVHLWIEDLEVLAAALNVPLVEFVRQRGIEYFAELTPSELRLLEALRDHGPESAQAILTLLRGAPSREHDHPARDHFPVAPRQRSAK